MINIIYQQFKLDFMDYKQNLEMAQLVKGLAAETEFSARVLHDGGKRIDSGTERCPLIFTHVFCCVSLCKYMPCVSKYTQNKINNKCKKDMKLGVDPYEFELGMAEMGTGSSKKWGFRESRSRSV